MTSLFQISFDFTEKILHQLSIMNSRKSSEQNKEWPPKPVLAETPKIQNVSHLSKLTKHGWLGFTIALTGLLLPVSVYMLLNTYFYRGGGFGWGGGIAWGEGGGGEVLYLCAIIIVISEAMALRLGIRAWPTVAGKLTIAIVIIILCLLGWFLVAYQTMD
jgi:hypothetical protein